MKLSTGCSALDSLLQGGIEYGTITEIFGGGGTGKTNLCLQLARNVTLNGKKVIYIDTEGVSMERLNQISGDQSEKVLKNLLLFRVHSFKEQEQVLEQAEKLVFTKNMDVGLVIVDSMTIFYRALLNSDERSNITSRLGKQMIKLLKIARKENLPVVITSQVYQSQSDGENRSLGGHQLYHNAKTIIKVDSIGPHIREWSLIKHRSLAEGGRVKTMLTSNGIETI
ncbi:MAG: DNA repair and recombination protein RadB [Thermoplasmata archaeon]